MIDGFKYDLRIYVFVNGINPLRVYIYKDGLARFATEKYEKPSDKNINNLFMHLTNYAINKFSENPNDDLITELKTTFPTIFTDKYLYSSIEQSDIYELINNLKNLIRKYFDDEDIELYNDILINKDGIEHKTLTYHILSGIMELISTKIKYLYSDTVNSDTVNSNNDMLGLPKNLSADELYEILLLNIKNCDLGLKFKI